MVLILACVQDTSAANQKLDHVHSFLHVPHVMPVTYLGRILSLDVLHEVVVRKAAFDNGHPGIHGVHGAHVALVAAIAQLLV